MFPQSEKNAPIRRDRGDGADSVRGGSSAQGDSVKARPVQDADVLRVEIEIGGEQRAKLANLTPVAQRLAQLHHTTPFVGGRALLRGSATGQEVRVILRSHDESLAPPLRPGP